MNTVSVSLQTPNTLAPLRELNGPGDVAPDGATSNLSAPADSPHNFSMSMREAQSRQDAQSRLDTQSRQDAQSRQEIKSREDSRARPAHDPASNRAAEPKPKTETKLKNKLEPRTRSERRNGRLDGIRADAAGTPAAGAGLPPDGKTLPLNSAAEAAHTIAGEPGGGGRAAGAEADDVARSGAAGSAPVTAGRLAARLQAADHPAPVQATATATAAAAAAAADVATASDAAKSPGGAATQAAPGVGLPALSGVAAAALAANAPGAAAPETNRAKPAQIAAKSVPSADAAAAKLQATVSLQRTLAAAPAGGKPSDPAAAAAAAAQSAGAAGDQPSVGLLPTAKDAGADTTADSSAKNAVNALPATPVPAAPDPGQSVAAAALADAAIPARQAPLPGAGGRDAGNPKTDGPVTSAAGPDAAGALAALQPNGANPATASAPDAAVFKMHQGLETPEFSQALADRVSWLIDKEVGAAKLQINPPQLGPIEVRVEVQGDKAQVWLSAHSVLTRDVLEASAPKLREMLGSQGFAQVSVDISQRSFQDRPAPPPRFDWAPAAVSPGVEAPLLSAESGARPAKLGALDAYA